MEKKDITGPRLGQNQGSSRLPGNSCFFLKTQKRRLYFRNVSRPTSFLSLGRPVLILMGLMLLGTLTHGATTGPGGVMLPAHPSSLGYLKVTENRSVPVNIPDLRRWFEIGEIAQLLQKNQYYYVGLFEFEGGFTDICAIPRVSREGEGTAWITQEKNVVIGTEVRSEPGRFYLRPSEYLPIVREEGNEYTVTCERYGHMFQLKLSRSLPGIKRLKKLPGHIQYLLQLKQQQQFMELAATEHKTDAEWDENLSNGPAETRTRPVVRDQDFIDPYPEQVVRVQHARQNLPRTTPSQQASPSAVDEPAQVVSAQTKPKPKRVKRHVIDQSSLSPLLQISDVTGTEIDSGSSKPTKTVDPVVEKEPEVEVEVAQATPVDDPIHPEVQEQPNMDETAKIPAISETQLLKPITTPSTSASIEPTTVASTKPTTTAPAIATTPTQPTTEAQSATKTIASTAPVPVPTPTGTTQVATTFSPKPTSTQQTQTIPGPLDVTHTPTPLGHETLTKRPAINESPSKAASWAMNFLIFIALLTAGFVVIVIALALILNRGKKGNEKGVQEKTKTGRKKEKKFGRKKKETLPSPSAAPVSASGTANPAGPELPDTVAHAPLAPPAGLTVPTDDGDSGTFTGSLESFSAAELIQFLNSSRETGVLTIDPGTDDMTSKLYFERGEIVDALSNQSMGEAAVKDILAFQAGLFSFNRQQEVVARRTIKESTMSLLLKAGPNTETSLLTGQHLEQAGKR